MPPDLTDAQLERGVGRLFLRYIALEEELADVKRYVAAMERLAGTRDDASQQDDDKGEGHAARMGERTA